MESVKQKANDFSKGSVIGHILRLALPMTAAQLITILYNVVDRVFIGRLGGSGAADALTGVGVCMPIITIIMAFSNLIGAGAAPLISIERGRNNADEAEKLLGNAASLLLIIGAVITVLGLCFKTPLLRLLGASDATLPYADTYITIYLFGAIFPVLTLGLNSMINAQGYGKIGMVTIALGAVLNIILDPILMFVLDMGVAGAAVATVISQAASAVWTVSFLLSKRAAYTIKFKNMISFSLRRVRKILSLGLAGFTMMATNAAVQSVCNMTLKQYGSDIYIGIMTIITSVRDILTLPVQGFSQGAQPVLGYNYGAAENKRVKLGIKYMSVILIVYTVIAWLIVARLSNVFMRLFTDDPEMIALGAGALHIYFFGFFFMALQFCGQTVFTALDKPKQAVFFSLFRKIIIVVPLTLLLPHFITPQVNGVFWAEPVSNLIGGAAAFITMILTVYKKL